MAADEDWCVSFVTGLPHQAFFTDCFTPYSCTANPPGYIHLILDESGHEHIRLQYHSRQFKHDHPHPLSTFQAAIRSLLS